MTTSKENFIVLINAIVENEFSPTQRQRYQIEGVELIDNLFQNGSLITSNQNATPKRNFAFTGVTPDEVKIGVDFFSLIISCFTLFFDYSKFTSEKKTSETENQLKKIELLKALKDDLIAQNMPADLINTISDKYSAEILKLMDVL